MNEQLFRGELVRLTAFDAEKDAETESRWTHNAEFARLTFAEPAKPLSPVTIKKKYDDEKEKERNRYRFAIRALADDRLIGFIALQWIEWNNGACFLSFGIADAVDRSKGYAREAVRLVLRYAFGELNLFRLSAVTGSYNDRAIEFLQRAGFQIEVRRREALHRDGRRWDAVGLGMLKDEWSKR
ncbi:MAG: GNAT family N-acetyltransferase [Chloroflexi bacterium]|nr:GNAT family N-acetyltransferase [Chloroflexota bacterium]